MYARPEIRNDDLTPFFAPFYMLFFGICLNDAGYGLILTCWAQVDAVQEQEARHDASGRRGLPRCASVDRRFRRASGSTGIV